MVGGPARRHGVLLEVNKNPRPACLISLINYYIPDQACQEKKRPSGKLFDPLLEIYAFKRRLLVTEPAQSPVPVAFADRQAQPSQSSHHGEGERYPSPRSPPLPPQTGQAASTFPGPIRFDPLHVPLIFSRLPDPPVSRSGPRIGRAQGHRRRCRGRREPVGTPMRSTRDRRGQRSDRMPDQRFLLWPGVAVVERPLSLPLSLRRLSVNAPVLSPAWVQARNTPRGHSPARV